MNAYKCVNFINMCIQVEELVDQALKNNFRALEEFLLNEASEGLTSKCSKQFLSKLDKLINRVGNWVSATYIAGVREKDIILLVVLLQNIMLFHSQDLCSM